MVTTGALYGLLKVGSYFVAESDNLVIYGRCRAVNGTTVKAYCFTEADHVGRELTIDTDKIVGTVSASEWAYARKLGWPTPKSNELYRWIGDWRS